MRKHEINRLIEVLICEGASGKQGREAIERLAQIGAPAVDSMLDALKQNPTTTLHPIDLWESIYAFLARIAETVPEKLIELLPQWKDTVMLFLALGYAKDSRSLDVLIEGLKNKNQYVRWAAAESLVKRRSTRAVPALLQSLADRSRMVKSTVLGAMKSNRIYRRPDALPLLRRIIDNKQVRKHSPNLCETASDLVAQIQKKDRGPVRRL